MKIAALVLGLLGSLLITALGAKWIADHETNQQALANVTAFLEQGGGNSAVKPVRGVMAAARSFRPRLLCPR